MEKRLFISWFSGDIWNEIYHKLLNNWFDIIWISGRDTQDQIQRIFDTSLDIEKENILINAIWCWVYGMFYELWEKDYQKSFEWNFLVPLKIFKCYVNRIRFLYNLHQKKLNATIININSKASLEVFGQWTAYSSMKCALTMALQVIQKENTKYWLQTKEIYPWMIKTKMIEQMPYIPKSGIQELPDFIQEFMSILD